MQCKLQHNRRPLTAAGVDCTTQTAQPQTAAADGTVADCTVADNTVADRTVADCTTADCTAAHCTAADCTGADCIAQTAQRSRRLHSASCASQLLTAQRILQTGSALY